MIRTPLFTRAEIASAVDAALVNLRLLNSCPGPHDFVCLTPQKPLGARWRCSVCQGTARGDAVKWYQEGLAHGRKANAGTTTDSTPTEDPKK